MKKITKNTCSKLFGFTTKTMYNWKQEEEENGRRPIVSFVQKYFNEEDAIELLETNSMKKMEIINTIAPIIKKYITEEDIEEFVNTGKIEKLEEAKKRQEEKEWKRPKIGMVYIITSENQEEVSEAIREKSIILDGEDIFKIKKNYTEVEYKRVLKEGVEIKGENIHFADTRGEYIFDKYMKNNKRGSSIQKRKLNSKWAKNLNERETKKHKIRTKMTK